MNKMKVNEFSVQFVEYMPEEILQGELYVSMKYSVVIHSCACGCGEKVVTPLSPDDWHLSYDGETISLKPSIGNWDFPCQSHYWIRENKVINAEAWDNQEAYKRTPWVSRKNSKLSKKKKGWKRFFEFIFS
ncbi:DUF6527 family protein [Mangrovibacterium lignilyticum]|uniref:DUF6527 family protein n=1 Tax=Mangrovibacterium lignilyticum TaxID=2668052 RepID=UPI001967C6C9|nr:DUF6527 family protein [Mangrovibacterium lignilyticum]